ncbi:hypothetical protein FHS95_003158 [Sphingomonas naasensis]|uniref:META domain-containing protein n=1 Tax=Sphingomonas naasensis TaxID=1344951 RepID=A0A4S1WEX6_9SPHN|nr:hypothetical protein [Sphingomonas naasensis]NIJ21455.1 hypothetical protein [Sphingomonas naasensis]TGX41588.1 hypothetical protein E5A74_13320 [Sphingomonas naasensis]
MRIATALSIAMLLFSAPAVAGDETAELVGHWGAVFTSKKLVRVPVLRDRPTVSLAGPGMVTKRGPLFSTVLRDEEVPMEVEHSVSLQIEADGRFKLFLHEQRAASPTNDCLVQAGSVREGMVSQANGRLLLRSNGGRSRSGACGEAPSDTREGESVYMVRRDGDTLILTADDGTVWQLRK